MRENSRSNFACRWLRSRLAALTLATYSLTKVSTSSGARSWCFKPDSTRSSSPSRSTVLGLEQVPRSRRLLQPSLPSLETTPIGPLQTPQRTRPDSNHGGRRAATRRPPIGRQAVLPVRSCSVVPATTRRPATRRVWTAFHSDASMMRNVGTGVMTQASLGFGRDTRLPVPGSLMKRCRFQTRSPAYSRLRSSPISRTALPRISDAVHRPPRGPGTPSRFSALAIARGESPPA